MRGLGPYAEMLRLRFDKACRRLNLNGRQRGWSLDTGKFRRPPQKGDQFSLL
jgi:hypothetical protein